MISSRRIHAGTMKPLLQENVVSLLLQFIVAKHLRILYGWEGLGVDLQMAIDLHMAFHNFFVHAPGLRRLISQLLNFDVLPTDRVLRLTINGHSRVGATSFCAG